MKTFFLAIALLSSTAVSAAPLHATFDMLQDNSLYTNHSGYGDNGGFISFSVSSQVDVNMYLVGYQYDTGAIADYAIAQGNNYTPIYGFLDVISGFNGYALIVAPVYLEFDLLSLNNGEFISNHLTASESKYTLTGIEPGLDLNYSQYVRPQGVASINERYESAQAVNVPEPATLALFALGIAGIAATRCNA